MRKVRAYYRLTKPGVMYGNVMTGAAGFLLAAGLYNQYNWLSFVSVIVGMTFVVSSACVLNNILDRDIDQKMTRTQKRPSLTGELSIREMYSFANILLAIGFLILIFFTNLLVVLIGLIGYTTYVWLYGALSKRKSLHGTLVGSISGAMPIAGGYSAVMGQVDITLMIVTLILFFWQFPEFYSISIFRKKEYQKAAVPVISVIRGKEATARWVLYNIYIYIALTIVLYFVNSQIGLLYIIVAIILGVYWLKVALTTDRTENIDLWAKKVFHLALINLVGFSLIISISPLLA